MLVKVVMRRNAEQDGPVGLHQHDTPERRGLTAGRNAQADAQRSELVDEFGTFH